MDVRKGIKAPQQLGLSTVTLNELHSCETVSYEDLDKYGNMQAAKEAGRVRLEGKDYVVQDGDVCCSVLTFKKRPMPCNKQFVLG